MKHLYSSLIALTLSLTPAAATLTPQPTLAQTQRADREIRQLLERAKRQNQQGQTEELKALR